MNRPTQPPSPDLEARLRLIEENLPVGMVTLDSDFRIQSANHAFGALIGRQPGEILGKSLCSFAHPDDVRAKTEYLHRLWDGGVTSFDFECRLSGLHDDPIHSRCHGLLNRARDGKPDSIVLFIEDVSGRKKDEATLLLQSAALEAAANAIVITDVNARIVWINPAFTALTGYEASEVIGQTPRVLKSGQHDEAFYRMLWDDVLQGRVWRGEITNRRKDGTLYIEENTITPVRDESRRIAYFICVKQNISDRKRLEDQLHHSQKMEALGSLAGGIAHDFNNMLTGIAGFSDLLLAQLERDSPYRRYVDEIKKAQQRAADLTRQLLAFGRRQVLRPRALDLNSHVRNMQDMLNRLIGENIDLSVSLDPVVGAVMADPGQIEQILMNLVVNARDAMPEGGTVHIQTGNAGEVLEGVVDPENIRPGPHVFLSVKDSGIGMEPETLGHIFEPFFTTKGPGRGTGLGLATVYGIVKQSSGHIGVVTAPGKGAAFHIYLPRVEKRDPSEKLAPVSMVVPRGSETILLAEDEEVVRGMVTEILQLSGYTVLEAGSPEDAEELAANSARPIDLLVTDVIMPRVSGVELARRLRAKNPRLKVIYISGYDSDGEKAGDARRDGDAYVMKPFTPEQLARQVRSALDGKA